MSMKNGAVISILASLAVVATSRAAEPRWARPDLVEKVERGELREANASWWGYDPTNSTAYLTAALRSGARKLTLDRQPGPWYTLPLWGRSNLTLTIPEGSELCALRGAFRRTGDRLITFGSATNVTLNGGGTLRMWFEDYTNKALYAWSEWRHAVTLQGCSSVLIENLNIEDSGGDGIYLGSQGRVFANTDVTIRNVRLRRNNRQGISVITADRLLIEDCVMEDTCGTLPMAGIDFEPNGPRQMLRNITVRNCVVRNNRGAGFDFSVGNLNSESPDISITLEDCRSEGNHKPTKFHHSSNRLCGFRGAVTFRRCTFNDLDGGRDTFRVKAGKETMSVTFEDCLAADPAKGGKMTPLGPEYGWGRLPVPKWPGGSPLKLAKTPFPDPGKVKVHDSSPGRMIELDPTFIRGRVAYMVYADSARMVRLKGKVCQVGRSRLEYCRFKVCSSTGDAVSSIELKPVFRKEQEISFRAPASGFYLLTGRVRFNHTICLTASDAPVAIVYSAESGVPGWSTFPAKVYLRIPEGLSRFAVSASGGGRNEMLRACLTSPDGVVRWDADNVEATEVWMSPERPHPGIWTLSSLKATKGCMDDYSFAVFGVPYLMFLSPERTW